MSAAPDFMRLAIDEAYGRGTDDDAALLAANPLQWEAGLVMAIQEADDQLVTEQAAWDEYRASDLHDKVAFAQARAEHNAVRAKAVHFKTKATRRLQQIKAQRLDAGARLDAQGWKRLATWLVDQFEEDEHGALIEDAPGELRELIEAAVRWCRKAVTTS